MGGDHGWQRALGSPAQPAQGDGAAQGVEALNAPCASAVTGASAPDHYALLTENWNRPGEEVIFLMTCFERVLAGELEGLEREQVRIAFLGGSRAAPPGPAAKSDHCRTARTAATRGFTSTSCTKKLTAVGGSVRRPGGMPKRWAG